MQKTKRISLSMITFLPKRVINERRAKKFARLWDPDALGILTVNLRESGEYVVLDGNHRCTAAIMLGIESLVFEVLELSPHREAEVFLKLNKERVSVNALDTFNVELEAGVKSVKEISAILKRVGVKLGTNRGLKTIKAVNPVRTLHRLGVLEESLKLAMEVWPSQERWDCHVLEGLGMFVQKSKSCEQFDRDRAVKILSKKTAIQHRALVNDTKSYKGVAICKNMVTEYNGHMRRPEKLI